MDVVMEWKEVEVSLEVAQLYEAALNKKGRPKQQ